MTKILIIAEAGVNHNGSVKTAKILIDFAAEAGADFVKFQTFKSEAEISRYAIKATYQLEKTDSSETQLEMVKKLELNEKSHQELIAHCIKRKIKFLSAPFDIGSIELLNRLGLETFKIPSGEITNLPYLRKIGSLSKTLILSTGMSNLGEIEFAVNTLVENGTKRSKIKLLHCNTEYPTPMVDVNLKAMLTMSEAFKLEIGYSDHTLGIEVPIAAAALGAKIIEKHFTLDRNMPGPDHKASLEPSELATMVKAIRNIELAFGDGIKRCSASESKNVNIARKSIVAACNISKGEKFSKVNITVKRPGNGISPLKWDELIGKKAVRNFKEDELIEL